MKTEAYRNPEQGHWVLAKAGKRILRPGGIELTYTMIDNLKISSDDDVVEFAPGLGITAALTCAKKPNSYTGVDINAEAADIVKKRLKYDKAKVVIASASETTLPDAYATKVYGEAMLSMQNDKHKIEIIKEAARILKPGGLYGIHELGLYPDNISDEIKKEIFGDISRAIQVQARPLTVKEWSEMLETEGFKVLTVASNPMHLVRPKRILQDEGFFRTLKIMFNVLTHSDQRLRVKEMRKVFDKHENHLNAISIVAQKL